MKKHFGAALRNIAKLGDTDIFPYPVENYIFFDEEEKALNLLLDMHKNFDHYFENFSPLNESLLSAVGYAGFRYGTQIDPIWNAYLLGLVISIGEEIEGVRIPVEKQTLFSYRFSYDDENNMLFDPSIGWVEFQEVSAERAKECSHVLICDISDFYPRVYHHRLENALKKATSKTHIIQRIMLILNDISKNVSYGLPIGGPAARLLSELLLNRMDRLLLANGVSFCRFVDDYHIFAQSSEGAYANLVLLSEKLLENEGLSLQKSKTRIMSSEEFLSLSEFAAEKETTETGEVEARRFLSLRLRFDPYSPTADEDYEELRKELNKFDIVGMLAREMGKSRIHQALTKKLVASVKYISDPSIRNSAIRSLVKNFLLLYPVFPNVMILLKNVLSDLEEETRNYIFDTVRQLIRSSSRIIKVPVNLGYAVRLLADDPSEEAEELLTQVYNSTTSIMIKRDIILVMTKRNADYWISDARHKYYSLTLWERRALIIASYILEDEGKHWRNNITMSPIDKLYRDWAANKKDSKNWSIPL